MYLFLLKYFSCPGYASNTLYLHYSKMCFKDCSNISQNSCTSDNTTIHLTPLNLLKLPDLASFLMFWINFKRNLPQILHNKEELQRHWAQIHPLSWISSPHSDTRLLDPQMYKFPQVYKTSLKCIKINHNCINHPQMYKFDHICINRVPTNV